MKSKNAEEFWGIVAGDTFFFQNLCCEKCDHNGYKCESIDVIGLVLGQVHTCGSQRMLLKELEGVY